MTKPVDIIIKWGFYTLFLLIPLAFYAGNSELFEYNKMVLTYGLTIIIVGAWLVKLITNHEVLIAPWKWIKRTPLDIPIVLYLLSHILSTIFSIDPHLSIWGYYSRFHEGLLATISYILLYYAAVSNLNRQSVLNILKVSFISAAIVSVYGTLEHFGHSPSCLFITGNFNVDCWVQDVKNRVFATLGQPNWMAAYLDVIILTSLGFFFLKNSSSKRTVLFLLLALDFAALLFTKSRSGLLGLAVGLAAFFFALLYQHRKNLRGLVAQKTKPLLVSLSLLLLLSLLFGLPLTQTEKLSLEYWLTPKTAVTATPKPASSGYIDIGISESGDIRKVVWTGALKVWQRYPIFGSGVETFAYAYYQDRPIEHNLLSEWDFLYNKAHNEFLNILATTGTVGFLSYLSILGLFTLWFIRSLINSEPKTDNLLLPALFAAWISILVTNFFGFSVVIIGLYFFLIPAFCFLLHQENEPKNPPAAAALSFSQIGLIGLIILIGLVMEINLLSMWTADKDYGYGKNLDSVQHFAEAYPYLKRAVDKNPNEPAFRDELSSNEAVLAAAIFQQASGSATEKLSASLPAYNLTAKNFVDQAVADSNQVVDTSPNAMPFWKTRTRVFYELGTIDPKFFTTSLEAIQKAAQLAPTDAKVHYNLGILLARTNQVPAAIKVFEETVALKPDYRDAYYALALYYDQTGDRDRAKQTMQLILQKIGPDPEAKKWLEEHK